MEVSRVFRVPKVLGKKILLKKIEKEQKKSTIILATPERETQLECEVIEMGEYFYNEENDINLKIGDLVIIDPYVGKRIEVCGHNFIVADLENILVVVFPEYIEL